MNNTVLMPLKTGPAAYPIHQYNFRFLHKELLLNLGSNITPVQKKNLSTYLSLFLFLVFQSVLVQSQSFHKNEKLTKQDTLRGSITPERAWWDVVKYDLAVTPNFKNFTISGSN